MTTTLTKKKTVLKYKGEDRYLKADFTIKHGDLEETNCIFTADDWENPQDLVDEFIDEEELEILEVTLTATFEKS